MISTVCELRQKEVINCRTGQRLGYICDVEFDTHKGKICNLIIPGPCKVWGMFGRDQEYLIPYECICCIGADVILVDVDYDECIRKCE